MQIAHRDANKAIAVSPGRVLYLEPAQSSPNASGQSSIADLTAAVKSHLWVLVVLGILGAVAGGAVALWQEPLYQSKTTIQIKAHSEQPTVIKLNDSDVATVGPSPDSFFQAEARVLESRSLHNAVIARLKNQRRNWKFVPPELFGVHLPDAVTRHIGFRKKQPKKNARLPGVAMSVKLFESAGVIEITTTSPNPQFAAAFANEMVQQYSEMQLSTASGVAEHNLSWMMRQLDNIKAKLQAGESNLQAYGHSAGVILGQDRVTTDSAKLSEIESELSHAQGERILRQSEYEVARANPIEETPQGLDNRLISEYQDRLTVLQKQLVDLQRKYTPKYYKVTQVQQQIADLQDSMKTERDGILSASWNQYQIAEKREKLLTDAYAAEQKLVLDRTDTAVAYDIRKHEVDSLRQLYDELLRKVQGNVIASFRSDWIRVIDPAEPAWTPYKPNAMRSLAMGSVAFMFLGLLFIVGGAYLQKNLRAPGETYRYLNVPELGVIPNIGSLPGRSSRASRSHMISIGLNGGERSGTAISTWEHPLLAESYRGAVTSLMGANNGELPPQVIVATSPNRQDGKSTTVSHFGIALAEMGKRVVLVDADLRKPSLHEMLDAPNNWGLSSILCEKTVLSEMPLEYLVRPTHIPSLSIITSGPGIANVSQLLYSGRVEELILRLRKDFDVILIDVPPIFGVADARIVARRADAGILILRAGRCSVEMAIYAKRRLEEDGIHVMGTVLNAWNGAAKPYHYYYGEGA